MKQPDQYWYSRNAIARLLLPLSLLFRLIVAIRRRLYASGLLQTTKVDAPVIVVGNISVGGTGKTPLLMALVELAKSAGFKPGVISRGYGGRYSGVKDVNADDSAEVSGDEPLLIKQRLNVPVVVGRQRVDAARYLLQHHDCDLILSDDGLQHYALARDLELAVIDSERMHGNGWLLPAGPLREPVSRLNSVDLIIYHGANGQPNRFSLKIEQLVNLDSGETRTPADFRNEPVHAVAGIGHPQRFFSQLRSTGLDIIEHAFADHHHYCADDFAFSDNRIIIMTEKDAVKCRSLGLTNAWYVQVRVRLSAELEQALRQKLAYLPRD